MKNRLMKCIAVPVMLAVCSLIYYFGELINWAAWEPLRRDFFYGIHDVHRLFFLVPIVYAGYCGRVRGALIVTLISFLIFLPRAFFISPYPDALLRMSLFTVFAGVVGGLIGQLRNACQRCQDLERRLAEEPRAATLTSGQHEQ
jgi:hypothetical protein